MASVQGNEGHFPEEWTFEMGLVGWVGGGHPEVSRIGETWEWENTRSTKGLAVVTTQCSSALGLEQP